MIDYEQYNDSELLTLLKENEKISKIAFEVIWNRYSKKLKYYCSSISKNKHDADELFQKSWIRFHEYSKKENKIESIKYYLFKIAYNFHILNIQDDQSDICDPAFNLDEFIDENNFLLDLECKDFLKQFSIALNYLECDHKESLILYWIEGFSFEEIAHLSNETYDCIRKRCSRGMQKVIKLLEPNFQKSLRRKKDE